MEVWLLWEHVQYEYDAVLGVYATEEAANKALEKTTTKHKMYVTTKFYVEKVEVLT